MNLLSLTALCLALLLAVLFGTTRIGVWLIERRNPPIGAFATVNDTRLHFVHLPPAGEPDLPPIVFIHGASGNLRDQLIPVRPRLEDRAHLLFIDRPGHGWSSRGPAGNADPHGQADTIAALMDHLGLADAIVVGHSYGGAVAATFALDHPEKTRGLVFLSAASHPWPGAGTAWYYRLTATPLIGWLFSETLALPGAWLSMDSASACVFSPNEMPQAYLDDAAIALLLRPSAFRANAIDVAGLYDHVAATAPRYGEIDAPAIVISGDSDTVVYEEIHSGGLIRDLPNAKGVWVENLGHKPDWIAPDLVVAAIEELAGKPVDLEEVARKVEARIADDDHATEFCSPASAALETAGG